MSKVQCEKIKLFPSSGFVAGNEPTMYTSSRHGQSSLVVPPSNHIVVKLDDVGDVEVDEDEISFMGMKSEQVCIMYYLLTY